MGAWIEILANYEHRPHLRVAPLVGAWIEIMYSQHLLPCETVAPLVGAWIEIIRTVYLLVSDMSLPLWERGLKCTVRKSEYRKSSRSPCGSVD